MMMMMSSTSTEGSAGSTTSSASSDVMTLTTTAASSWCAMPSSTRIRVVRLLRPHQRRLLVVPERSAAYGFAVRGGKEHGIGFFVSHVEQGGEAQLKGLRIGDQILRINGYRLEDAVHKEFIQLVAGQDRVTLKVRGVGMLPVKDQPDERLSWNVVKLPSVSGTPSESSFKVDRERERDREKERRNANLSRDINVVLHVAPRTKLGLGICKGPEWKPGIFVQFTKERSVAREAGLRPGDQILSVNSIDFSDVLFSEAVAVMKGSSKLDMIVRTAAGCDLFPGESSGYNSSASSVTGDQSPCWADAKSKRLTAVREEPPLAMPATHKQQQQLNKTIIKLTENGTSINNTYIASASACAHSASSSSHSHSSQEEQSISRSTTIRRGGAAATTTMSPATAPPPPAAPLNNASNTNNNNSSSSLSSAINEELKKRKEKLQQVQQRNNHTSRDRIAAVGSGIGNGAGTGVGVGVGIASEERSHIGSRSVAQVSHKRERNNGSTGANCGAAGGAPSGAPSGAGGAGGAAGGGDQHSALMDEFKRAHQRMFRNGFHESEHKERGETLKRTSFMPDDSCYRNNNNNNNNSNKIGNSNIGNNGSNRISLLNGASNNNNNNNSNGSTELPPPPPQFANPQKQQQQQQLKLNLSNGAISRKAATPTSTATATATSPPLLLSPVRSPSINVGGMQRAPATPQPDYDAANGQTTTNGSQQQQQQQRRTLRLGTVTIGEYGEQRTKRETLRKTPSIGREGHSNGILKNGSRSSASFSNNNNNNSSSSSSNNRQQQQQAQHTEKSIKFGN